MSLHSLRTTISPTEYTALLNAVTHIQVGLKAKAKKANEKNEHLSNGDRCLMDNCDTASLWLAAVAEKLYDEWEALPAGSHLKEAYADQVWNWSDRDMAGPSEADLKNLNFMKPIRPRE
tara:strand:+ start:143 stop:499 length:357 start_codon:yes stop_codon:yes gene_type:complete